MTALNDMSLAVRLGRVADQHEIIKLSQRVQDKLTASGSLQQTGPLEPEVVGKAIANQECLVLEHHQSESFATKVIGCALSRELDAGYFLTTPEFDMERFPAPWLYLQSIMLDPENQSSGIGVLFVSDVVEKIASVPATGGTLFLDCWAGNEKLRDFYSKVGFDFVAVIPEEDYEIAVFSQPLFATTSVASPS